MAFRYRSIVGALLCVVSVPMFAPAATSRPCADFRFVKDVGYACRRSPGVLEVFTAGGMSLGFTHGPDGVAGTSGSRAVASARPPACVTGAAGDYYAVAIYARATNDADGYASKAGTIRGLVESANGMLAEAAVATGDMADLKVHCTSGVITVRNAVLPTPASAASFSTIVTDLRALGYNDSRLKYWVYYDDTGACSCAGMAHFQSDDSATAGNLSNGNAVSPMFAVTFGYNSATTMLHELSHTMGAVQDSSPNSTQAGHCIDGADVMCYNDGGPRGGSYSTTACATQVFDCGKNDYFHTRPAGGSYLATHWNLGSRLNRYLLFDASDAPTMVTLVCPPKGGTGSPVACSFRATDESTGVFYTVSWGDGTSTRVPASGTVAPGTTQGAAHTYGAAATRTITVSATDNGATPRTSPALTSSVQIVVDGTRPTMTLTAPAEGTLYRGCGSQVPVLTGRPVFTGKSCIIVGAADTGSGVAGATVYLNGVRKGFWTKAPFRIEFVVAGPATAVPLKVEVRDYAGNAVFQTILVDIL